MEDLRDAGVTAAFGAPAEVPGVRVHAVDDIAVARLLADAHVRLHGRGAAVLPPDGSEAELVLPEVGPRWLDPGDEAVAAVRAAAHPVVLAGPGVVRLGCVPGLHAIAAAAGLGVLNTWGAKGVFDWRSRHHLATAGLQARDFELGGLGPEAADLVVRTGVDPREAPWVPAPGQRVLDLPPGALDPLSERWARTVDTIELPPLRTGLAAATQAGWASTATPLAPSQATRNHATAVAGGGLVAADPGVAGFWVARTFATTELGGVHVPAERDAAGFAAACVAVARLADPGRPALAVVDGPVVAPVVDAVVAAGRRLGVAVPVEVWSDEGEALDADAHLAAVIALARRPAGGLLHVRTDATQLARFVDVAGPVTAWGGLPSIT